MGVTTLCKELSSPKPVVALDQTVTSFPGHAQLSLLAVWELEPQIVRKWVWPGNKATRTQGEVGPQDTANISHMFMSEQEETIFTSLQELSLPTVN